MPAVAAHAVEDDPEMLVLDIIDVREYARCKAVYEIPTDEKNAERRERALEHYFDEFGAPKPLLVAVETNARELFAERNPNIKLGVKKT